MKSSSNNQEINLSQQPFACSDKLSQIISDNIRGLKTKLPALHRSMSLYLANPDTEYILLRPVKVSSQQVLLLRLVIFLLFCKNLKYQAYELLNEYKFFFFKFFSVEYMTEKKYG